MLVVSLGKREELAADAFDSGLLLHLHVLELVSSGDEPLHSSFDLIDFPAFKLFLGFLFFPS